MRIKRADIFGFGKWVDKTFHFPKQSLTCIYGENESGKTTLQQFIIYMLFGFPPRKRTFYQPKKSSKLGGRLVVHHSNIGEFSIERLDDEIICYLPDGKEADEQWLNEQLNGMTEEMYRSIYSFSALDLSNLQEMEDDSLGEILFSIGLTGATDIYTVERNIERDIGQLFKPSGRIPIINKQLTSLNRLYQRAAKYERQETSYQEKKEDYLSVTQQINELEQHVEKSKKDLFTYEKIRHILPTIKEYHHYTEQLNSFQQDPDFPENGVERLNQLKNKLIPLQSELQLLKENEQNYKTSYNKIIEKIHSEEERNHAMKLLEENKYSIEQNKLLENKKDQLRDLKMQMEYILNELNIGLTVDEIKKTSLPFQIEVTWVDLNKEKELLHLEKEQLAEEKNILLRKKETLQKNKAKYMTKLLSEERLQSLQDKLATDEQFKVQLREQQMRKEKWETTEHHRQTQAKKVFYSSLGIAFICLVSSFMFKLPIFYLLSSLSVVIGLGYQYMTKRSLDEMRDLLIGKTMSNLSNLTDEKRLKIQQLIKDHDIYSNELQMIDKAMQEIHIDELKWEERNHLYVQKENKLNELIHEQLLQFPFLKDIPVVHWLEILDTLKQLKQKMNRQNQLEEKCQQLNDYQQSFKQRINNFFKRINDDNEQPKTIEIVETWLQKERDLLREKEQYETFIQQTKNKREKIENKLSFFEKEIEQLFTLANVDTEEQYYAKLNEVEQYKSLQKEKDKCKQQLNLTFSKEDKKKIIEQPFNENEIELNIKTLNEQMKKTNEQIGKKRELLAEIEAELKQMEMSDQLSEVTHQIEIEREKLSDLVFEWTVLQTTMEALNKSKRAYQDKYLTEVMNKTSTYFSLITNDAYEKVFPPQAGNSFIVQAPDYTRYDVKELSQGTINQLYVSLRLAISEVMSERYNVPFMIDDAFVHFDAERTKNIIDVLLEIGKTQQIVLFTCKEDICQFVPEKMVQQINHYVSVH